MRLCPGASFPLTSMSLQVILLAGYFTSMRKMLINGAALLHAVLNHSASLQLQPQRGSESPRKDQHLVVCVVLGSSW